MKYKLYIPAYLLILIAVGFQSAFAQSRVQNTFDIQGRLLDKDNKPYKDGEYSLTFRLYDGVRENPLYEEKDTKVNVLHGVFNYTLGAGQYNLPKFDQELLLGIQIAGEAELKPRLRIGSVPTASIAKEAKFADTAKFSLSSETSHFSVRSDTATYALNTSVPIGCIMPFAGTPDRLPQEWMICDGRALSSKVYPDLKFVIGTNWGTGEGKEIDFNIPDLRGLFLRGVDDGAGRDPKAYARESYKPGANSGAGVGSYQASSDGRDDDCDGIPETLFGGGKPSGNTLSSKYKNTYSSAKSEARPKNVAVFYIIKVK
jgi:hypothetical protein